MQYLNDMYLFAKVVEHGGYSAAARALGMPTSRLSRRIVELEQALDVRLLNRTTRKISMTEVGRQFHQHCVALVAEASAARDTIEHTRAEPSGLVRISCPLGLLHSRVGAIAADFLQAHPLVRLHVDATNRRVDVVDEGYDIALRVRTPPLLDSDLVVRPLGSSQLILLASPALLAAHGEPSSLSDLDRFQTLSMTSPGERHRWQFEGPDGQVQTHVHTPRLITDDFVSLRQGALNGLGLTFLPEFMAHADIENGLLRHVLPQFALPQGVVHAVFPSRRGMAPAVRALIDALVRGFSD
jgi:DNA-binding transcriptional LysR family regulator